MFLDNFTYKSLIDSVHLLLSLLTFGGINVELPADGI